jgi:hypothetical protein
LPACCNWFSDCAASRLRCLSACPCARTIAWIIARHFDLLFR